MGLFILVAQEITSLLIFIEKCSHLAVTFPLGDENLKTLFWIGANFHHSVDLPDTTGLDWRETVIRCLERILSRSRAQSDPEHSQPFTDRELQPAVTRSPEPEEKRTALTLSPEVELPRESDQGFESATSADEGIVTMDNEDWLRDFSDSHPVPSS